MRDRSQTAPARVGNERTECSYRGGGSYKHECRFPPCFCTEFFLTDVNHQRQIVPSVARFWDYTFKLYYTDNLLSWAIPESDNTPHSQIEKYTDTHHLHLNIQLDQNCKRFVSKLAHNAKTLFQHRLKQLNKCSKAQKSYLLYSMITTTSEVISRPLHKKTSRQCRKNCSTESREWKKVQKQRKKAQEMD